MEIHSPEPVPFARFMALRHPTQKISKIVPKTSLIEHPDLRKLANEYFDTDPVAIQIAATGAIDHHENILEWLAYHRVIGVEGFLVYTNDCKIRSTVFKSSKTPTRRIDLIHQCQNVSHENGACLRRRPIIV